MGALKLLLLAACGRRPKDLPLFHYPLETILDSSSKPNELTMINPVIIRYILLVFH